MNLEYLPDWIYQKMDKFPNQAFIILVRELREFSIEKKDQAKEKYGNSWHNTEPEYLLRRAEEEFYEFRQAVERDKDIQSAINELADFNNFALMYLIRIYQEGNKQ